MGSSRISIVSNLIVSNKLDMNIKYEYIKDEKVKLIYSNGSHAIIGLEAFLELYEIEDLEEGLCKRKNL